jgi:hypothetical protein
MLRLGSNSERAIESTRFLVTCRLATSYHLEANDLVLDLFTGSLAPTTYDNYGTGMRRFTVFCDEEGIIPLHATAADMLPFTTWLARSGTVAAMSLHPYLWSRPRIVQTSDIFYFIPYPKKLRIDQKIINTLLRVCFRRYRLCQWRGWD